MHIMMKFNTFFEIRFVNRFSIKKFSKIGRLCLKFK